jgi:putative transferase (TIGR04331 family)
MSDKLFLATTALEEFWDKSKPILFLGEWCGSSKNKNETLRCDHHYSLKEYSYTIEIYERLMPIIAGWLNKIHSKSFSLRYWQIIVGPFLLWYIQVIYDRYFYLKTAYSLYPGLYTIGLSPTSYKTPINTLEFFSFATEDDVWNLQLFTQLIDLYFSPLEIYKDYKGKKNTVNKNIYYKPITKIKLKTLKKVFQWRSKKSIGIYFCGFSNKSMYRLMFSSGFRIFPIIKMEQELNSHEKNRDLDLKKRNELEKLITNDEFVQLVLSTLKFNFPMNFVENYNEEDEKSEKCFPYSPDMIVAAGWNIDDNLKMWGARKAEQGVKLVDLQHGGGYGTHLYSSREYLERQNCDAFISWGWKNGCDVFPAPAVSACEKTAEKKHIFYNTKKNGYLWITNEVPRYLVSIDQSLHSIEKNYLDAQVRFAKKLDKNVFSLLTIRSRPSSNGHEKLQASLPYIKIKFPKTKDSFFDDLCLAKLVISDNLQTTFLYALAFNVPTIVFCDNVFNQINKEAKIFFNNLQSSGIYHDSPESAAEKINEIYLDPSSWWNTEIVQSARKNFCDRFIRTSSNWVSDWKKILLDLQKTC